MYHVKSSYLKSTTISFLSNYGVELMQDLNISCNTAIRYLELLQQIDLIEKKKIGRDNFYVNKALTEVLINPK
jgi:hypothetical protein